MVANPGLNSQQKLSRRTGLGQTTIGRIRRGEGNATVESLKAIADAFGVTVGYLCGEEKSSNIPAPAWPFGLEKHRFDALTDERKRTLELLIRGQIEEWESMPGKGKRGG